MYSYLIRQIKNKIFRGGNKIMKKLCKSNTQKMICGVCGGVAEYFEIDPTLVRIAFVLLSIFAGSGLLLYFLAAIIMPMPETGC